MARFTTIVAGVNGNNTLVSAPAATLRIVVLGMSIVADADVSFYLRSGTTGSFVMGDDTVRVRLGFAGSPMDLPNTGTPWFQCDAGEALVMNTNGTPNIAGSLVYRLVDKDLEAI